MVDKTWDASAYDQGHSYVWKKAADLIELLDPRPGERVLDVGCGTGHLTAQIAGRGAVVVGMDASVEMIGRARAQHGGAGIEFFVGDVTSFRVDRAFDAVFSNATLHWVPRAAEAARHIFDALRPGGRFVAEFGGSGNVQKICRAIDQGLGAVGASTFEELCAWYFPSIAEYSGVLEGAGFEVTMASLFDRPTEVEGGMRAWVEMFGSTFLDAIPAEKRESFFGHVERAARDLERDGKWYADYRRLRVVAVRPPI
jgi:trans-aconitate methyltransferase